MICSGVFKIRTFARPKVVSSRCIEFDACRYDGQMIQSDFVKTIKPLVDFLPICPEFEMGLGIPRQPIRMVKQKGEIKLIQPSSNLDLTDRMRRFSDSFLTSVGEVDGFILKFRSPSCGLKDVRVYPGTGREPPTSKSPGFFGSAVLRRFPGLAVEDEGRLRNLRIRDRFLTKLYTLASFREARDSADAGELVRFHTQNKLLLMAHCQQEARVLGRIAANHRAMGFERSAALYFEHLQRVLSKNPRPDTNINVLMRTMGRFSNDLSTEERQQFQEILAGYKEGRAPLSAPASIVMSWIARFDNEYLRAQTFFAPYPKELIEICSQG